MVESKKKKPGGLRFEIFPITLADIPVEWRWRLVGKDGIVCESHDTFVSDVEARSHLAKNKGRLKTSGFAKVVNVEK